MQSLIFALSNFFVFQSLQKLSYVFCLFILRMFACTNFVLLSAKVGHIIMIISWIINFSIVYPHISAHIIVGFFLLSFFSLFTRIVFAGTRQAIYLIACRYYYVLCMLSCNLMVFICAFRFIFEKCVCLVVALNFMTL